MRYKLIIHNLKKEQAETLKEGITLKNKYPVEIKED